MKFQIITFYEFKRLANLDRLRDRLKSAMKEYSIFGTVIIAEEGFNSTVCGNPADIEQFVPKIERILETKLNPKTSFHKEMTFQRRKVKIKDEIVTFRQAVDFELGTGTHVDYEKWNQLILDPEIVVLDARNDYEYQIGTFQNAINPSVSSFCDLPDFVSEHLDPKKNTKVAMFCTGGIRCEKLAPYLKSKGFEEVFQLDGGILKYLENIPAGESLWSGECFVFDERISLGEDLKKGDAPDLSIDSGDIGKD